MSTTQNEVRFNDGEALILSDLHDMQRFLKSMVFDQFLGSMARQNIADSGFPNSTIAGYCLVPHAGSGYAAPGASALQVTNAAGMIYQWTSTSTPDGLSCNLLGYQLAAGELASTMATADPSNPRLDAVCVKLSYDDNQDSQTRDFQDGTTQVMSSQTFNKKRRTVLTKQVVTGTPNASPAVPATPAGYAVYCYVYVPAAYSSTLNEGYVWDERLPMHLKTVKVFPSQGIIGSNFSVTNGLYISNSGAGTLWMPFPYGAGCRVVGINPVGTGYGAGNVNIKKYAPAATTVTTFPIAYGFPTAVAASTQVSLSTASWPVNLLTYIGIMSAMPPIWGNGSTCGAYTSTGGSRNNTLLSEFTGSVANDTRLNHVEWIYAF